MSARIELFDEIRRLEDCLPSPLSVEAVRDLPRGPFSLDSSPKSLTLSVGLAEAAIEYERRYGALNSPGFWEVGGPGAHRMPLRRVSEDDILRDELYLGDVLDAAARVSELLRNAPRRCPHCGGQLEVETIGSLLTGVGEGIFLVCESLESSMLSPRAISSVHGYDRVIYKGRICRTSELADEGGSDAIRGVLRSFSDDVGSRRQDALHEISAITTPLELWHQGRGREEPQFLGHLPRPLACRACERIVDASTQEEIFGIRRSLEGRSLESIFTACGDSGSPLPADLAVLRDTLLERGYGDLSFNSEIDALSRQARAVLGVVAALGNGGNGVVIVDHVLSVTTDPLAIAQRILGISERIADRAIVFLDRPTRRSDTISEIHSGSVRTAIEHLKPGDWTASRVLGSMREISRDDARDWSQALPAPFSSLRVSPFRSLCRGRVYDVVPMTRLLEDVFLGTKEARMAGLTREDLIEGSRSDIVRLEGRSFLELQASSLKDVGRWFGGDRRIERASRLYHALGLGGVALDVSLSFLPPSVRERLWLCGELLSLPTRGVRCIALLGPFWDVVDEDLQGMLVACRAVAGERVGVVYGI